MLLITLEGFTPAALSCYGSSWNQTPAIDRLASVGSTWDRVIASCTDPLVQWDRWVQAPAFPVDQMTLITDDERLPNRQSASRLGEIVLVDSSEPVVAEGIEDTLFGRLIAIAAEQLEHDRLVWLHSRFLTRCWDAPRDLFPMDDVDPEDTEVPTLVPTWQPPHLTLNDTDDPDWITAWMRTYGCQIRLIDLMLEVVADMVERSQHPVLAIAGTSGFALGQNGNLGHCIGDVRSCQLHVPVVTNIGTGIRSPHVVSADHTSTVLGQLARLTFPPGVNETALIPFKEWQSQPKFNDEPNAAEVTSSADECMADALFKEAVITEKEGLPIAVTTENWFYVVDVVDPKSENLETSHMLSPEGRLFLKPDDLNDVNDVARLRDDQVAWFEKCLSDARS